MTAAFSLCKRIYDELRHLRTWWKRNGGVALVVTTCAMIVWWFIASRAGTIKPPLLARFTLGTVALALTAILAARGCRRRVQRFMSGVVSLT